MNNLSLNKFLKLHLSIQKWVLKGLFVPYSLLVEHEDLLSLHIPKQHFLIEHISSPHELVGNGFSWNFFEILHIYKNSFDLSEQEGLMKNNLLSMRDELRVPGEVSLLDPSSREESKSNQRWKEHLRVPQQQVGRPRKNHSAISIPPSDCPLSLIRLVKEKTVLVCLNSVEVGVVVDH